MGLVPDESAVQELTAASADPVFGDRVHAGRRDVAEHGPDPGIGEDRVELAGPARRLYTIFTPTTPGLHVARLPWNRSGPVTGVDSTR